MVIYSFQKKNSCCYRFSNHSLFLDHNIRLGHFNTPLQARNPIFLSSSFWIYRSTFNIPRSTPYVHWSHGFEYLCITVLYWLVHGGSYVRSQLKCLMSQYPLNITSHKIIANISISEKFQILISVLKLRPLVKLWEPWMGTRLYCNQAAKIQMYWLFYL